MEYEPKEGVDYVIDLYAIAKVPPEADDETIRVAIRDRSKEYHPDRMEGLAPELRERGERITRLLNRARIILLDTDKRAEYDEILSNWTGPISSEGIPAISLERHVQTQMQGKTPEEIEAGFVKDAAVIAGMVGDTPGQLSFLENMIQDAGDEVSDELRQQYENALLQHDRVLAIDEAERSRLLGRPDIEERQFRATLNYGEDVSEEITQARERRKTELQLQMLGGVSTRLALLSGEGNKQPSVGEETAESNLELPAYFDDQAQRVQELAKQREDIVEKRLANLALTYPQEALQVKLQPDLALGIVGEATTVWLRVVIRVDDLTASVEALPDELKQLLEAGDTQAVIQQNYNVLTVTQLEQVNQYDVINAAIDKHIAKYEDKNQPEA